MGKQKGMFKICRISNLKTTVFQCFKEKLNKEVIQERPERIVSAKIQPRKLFSLGNSQREHSRESVQYKMNQNQKCSEKSERFQKVKKEVEMKPVTKHQTKRKEIKKGFADFRSDSILSQSDAFAPPFFPALTRKSHFSKKEVKMINHCSNASLISTLVAPLSSVLISILPKKQIMPHFFSVHCENSVRFGTRRGSSASDKSASPSASPSASNGTPIIPLMDDYLFEI